MSDEILDKLKAGQPISSDEIKKSTQDLKSLNESLIEKNFTFETSENHSDKKSNDDK